MKKLIALLLALIMVLSLAACGAQEDAPADEPVAETPAETPVEETPAENTTQVEQAEKTNEEAITVTYFCTIGAYLDVLTAEIDKWNAGEGAEKGVYIELTSNINDGSSAITLQMQSGNHWDLMDGTSTDEWIYQGWVQDLSVIDDPELKELIASYEPYMQPNLSWKKGILCALPLEVVPLKMAVNVDLFESAGYKPEDLKTWDDVVAIAQAITEANPGTAWGYGMTTWGSFISRLTFQSSSSSTKYDWFNPETQTYEFDQYEIPMKALQTIYQNGWSLGLDDLAIDPIRAEFAAGKVGMFPAPAYDWAVYTNQFPAECNFTFVDMPIYGEEGGKYQGVYLDRLNCGIDAVNYAAADDAKKAAIVDAFLFLNSDELYSTIYANGGMIPYKPELMEGVEMVITKNVDQWVAISDLTNYTSVQQVPGGLPLEGDSFNVVMMAFLHGDYTWEEAVADLEERYNQAYQDALQDPDLDLSYFTDGMDYDRSK